MAKNGFRPCTADEPTVSRSSRGIWPLSLVLMVVGALPLRAASPSAAGFLPCFGGLPPQDFEIAPIEDTYGVDWRPTEPIVSRHDTEPRIVVSKSDVVPHFYYGYLRFSLPDIGDEYALLGAELRLHVRWCAPQPYEPNPRFGVHKVLEP